LVLFFRGQIKKNINHKEVILMYAEKGFLINLSEDVIGASKDLLQNATITIAREQELAVKMCGKGILYKIKAIFSKKVFLEHQICMNNAVLKSFDSGIKILRDGMKQYAEDPIAIQEINDGISLFEDLKDQWGKNLIRLKVYQNSL
jgi:hypothetical protein